MRLFANLIVTYAATDEKKGFFGGITAFLIHRGQRGISIVDIDKSVLQTCPLGEIHFESCILHGENILGKIGSGGQIFHTSMLWERICLSAIHIGAMTRLLNKATDLARSCNSAEKQNLRMTLADLATSVEAAKLMMYKSAKMLDDGRNVTLEAARTKLFISELFSEFTSKMISIFPEEALDEYSDLSRLVGEASASRIYSGTSEMQRNIIRQYIK